ncbi:hypothetical protein QOT17_009013 [Balamuthia mandrillaris]
MEEPSVVRAGSDAWTSGESILPTEELSVEQKKKILKETRSLQEFTKLWKISIPKASEARYYLDVLSEAHGYFDSWALLQEFIQMEKYSAEKGIGPFSRYRAKVTNLLRDVLKDTKAYRCLQEYDTNKISVAHPLRIKTDKRADFVTNNEWLLSIDIITANYTTATLFDAEAELAPTWQEFCEKQADIHLYLPKAKIFRQIVFGFLNTKVTGLIQSRLMECIHSHLVKVFGDDVTNRIIFTSNDEIVIHIGNGALDGNNLEYLNKLWNRLSEPIPIEAEAPMCTPALEKDVHYRCVLYKMKGIGDHKTRCMRTTYSPLIAEDEKGTSVIIFFFFILGVFFRLILFIAPIFQKERKE